MDAPPGGSKFFLGGISGNTTTEMLSSYFSRLGEVVDCKAMEEQGGKPRGFGFVTFRNALEAYRNGILRDQHRIDGRVIDVKTSISKEQMSRMEEMQRPVLCVRGLSSVTSIDTIYTHFSMFGTVVSISVAIDATGQPTGEAFVEYATTTMAKNALHAPIIHNLDSCDVELHPQHTPPTGNLQTKTFLNTPAVPYKAPEAAESFRGSTNNASSVCKVFVGGLSGDMTENELVNHFSQYGTVTAAEIMRNHQTGQSRNFGFVVFKDEMQARRCLESRFQDIRGKRVEVKSCVKKGDPSLAGKERGGNYVGYNRPFQAPPGGYQAMAQQQFLGQPQWSGSYGSYGYMPSQRPPVPPMPPMNVPPLQPAPQQYSYQHQPYTQSPTGYDDPAQTGVKPPQRYSPY